MPCAQKVNSSESFFTCKGSYSNKEYKLILDQPRKNKLSEEPIKVALTAAFEWHAS